MNGVYLFYTSAGSPSLRREAGSSTTTAPPDPAVIVLTEPLRSVVPSGALPISVCDVDLLQLLYLAFSNSFFLLLCSPDAIRDGVGGAALTVEPSVSELRRRAQAKVDAFFDNTFVQQRTCRLTLGSPSGVLDDLSSSSQRHFLLLSPPTAVAVMQQQQWLRDLHESPSPLRHAAQVAATLLLSSRSRLYMSTPAVMAVVTTCTALGDTCTAARVLACVARAIQAGVPGEPWGSAGISALALAKLGAPPLMPLCIPAGGSWDARNRREADASPPPPPPPPPLPLMGGADEPGCAALCVHEAYSTYTTATTTTPALNLIGGSMALSCSTATEEPPCPHVESSQAVLHVLVCVALGGAAGEQAADVARPKTRHLLPPLLRCLQEHLYPPPPRDRGSEESAEVQMHVSVRGQDVVARPSPPLQRYQSGDVVVPMTGCSVAEALTKLHPDALDALTPSYKDGDDEDEEEEAEDVISFMLRQCEGTMRHIQREAQRHRLLRMRHHALQRQQQQQQRCHEAVGTASSPSLPQAVGRAAVVLCVDEAHLAQWAERHHTFSTPFDAASREQRHNNKADCTMFVSLQWTALAGVPIYVCLIPSSVVTPPRLLSRLCAAAAIEQGVEAAQQLCSHTGGAFIAMADHAHREDQREREGRSGTSTGDEEESDDVDSCRYAALAVVAHLCAWATAALRDVHWCVLSELPAETQRAEGETADVSQLPDTLPRCALCTPAVLVEVRDAAVHVRLWRCPASLLSPCAPSLPVLAYEALTAPPASDRAGQPWMQEMTSHYAFAVAQRTRGLDDCRAVSPIVRVQPRLPLFKPGPLLRWYNTQFHFHTIATRLAAVLEAQVEHVKSVVFVLAATEGDHSVRRDGGSSVVSPPARKAQAEAVMTALRLLTAQTAKVQEEGQDVLRTLQHLLPLELVEDHSAPLPPLLLEVTREVEAERQTQSRSQRRHQGYQLGGPITPPPHDASSAATRLLSLMLLRARLLAAHAHYAYGSGDEVQRIVQEMQEASRGKPQATVVKAQRSAERVGQRARELYREVLASVPVNTASATHRDEAEGQKSAQPPQPQTHTRHAGPLFTTTTAASPSRSDSVSEELPMVHVLSPQEQRLAAMAPSQHPPPEHENTMAAHVLKPSGTAARLHPLNCEVTVDMVQHEEDAWYGEANRDIAIDLPPSQSVQHSTLSWVQSEGVEAAHDAVQLPIPRTAMSTEPPASHRADEHRCDECYGDDTQHVNFYTRPSFDVQLPPAVSKGAFDAWDCQLFDVQPPSASHVSAVLPCETGACKMPRDAAEPRSTAPCIPPPPSVSLSREVGERHEEAAPWVYLPGEVHDGAPQPYPVEEEEVREELLHRVHGGVDDTSAAAPAPEVNPTSPTAASMHAHVDAPTKEVEMRLSKDSVYVELPPSYLPQPPPPRECEGPTAGAATTDTTSCQTVETSNVSCDDRRAAVQHVATQTMPDVANSTLSAVASSGEMAEAPYVEGAHNGGDGKPKTGSPLEGSATQAEAAAATANVVSPTEHRHASFYMPSIEQGGEEEEEAALSTTSTQATVDTRRPGSAMCVQAASPGHPSSGVELPAETTLPYTEATPMMTPKARPHRVQLSVPPPPRDLRWCGVPCARPATALAALLTPHLPHHAAARTSALHVVRYAGGQLTVEALDATTAALAAVDAHPVERTSSPPSLLGRASTPAAHLILFTVDAETGRMRLCESHACPIAPGVSAQTLLAQQQQQQRSGDTPARARHTFTKSLAPGTAVAVAYVGVRHGLAKGVTAADVLWVDGLAVSLEAPAVRQVRVSGVRSDGFAVEWGTLTPQTVVKILTTEIATPPLGAAACSSAPAAEVPDPHTPAAAMRGRRSMVNVSDTSPAVVTGLRSASIYCVQLLPTPCTRRTVHVVAYHQVSSSSLLSSSSPPSSPSHGQPHEVELEWVVDAGVGVCAVMAATSLALSPDCVRVTEVSVAAPTDASALPRVSGVVACPMLHYRTAVFPVSLLRHCALLESTSAHQQIRLHLTITPLLCRDAGGEDDDTTLRGSCAEGGNDLTITLAGGSSNNNNRSRSSIGGLAPLSGTKEPVSARVRRLRGRVTADGGNTTTCRHVFTMRAGAEVEVALSLCVQLDAELVSLTVPPRPLTEPRGPSALHYVSLLEALQRCVQPAVLGPFHVCQGQLHVHCESPCVSELTWEGSCAVFDVVVRKMRAEGPAQLGGADTNEAAVEGTNPQRCSDGDEPERTEPEHVYQVRGRRLDAADDDAGACGVAPPLYRATLRLTALQPSSEYVARVRCGEHHIGGPLQGLWRTQPLPPPPGAVCAIFDAATRRLFLRFLQLQVEAQLPASAPRASYQAVIEPLGTCITVPVSVTAGKGRRGRAECAVHRVVDCSVVAPGTPISLCLHRRIDWPLCAQEPSDNGDLAAVRSDDVVLHVLSDVRVSLVGAGWGKGAEGVPPPPLLELAWTCSDAAAITYVEVNKKHRVRMNGEARNRVRLTLSQLRTLAATPSQKDSGDAYTNTCSPCRWMGVLCVTAFGGPTLVPDRCLPVILPPPPDLPASVLVVANYEDAACVDVDVAAVYRLYHAALGLPEAQIREGGGECVAMTSHLAGVLRQRVRLSLDVQRIGHGSDVRQKNDAEHHLLIQQPNLLRCRQRLRLPLPSYRPFDGHLNLSLHVSVTDAPCDSPPSNQAAGEAADSCAYHFFLPVNLSSMPLAVPVPPAEPITDVAISAVTASSAVLDWTPPRSLLQRLRQQSSTDVAYEVQLYSARGDGGDVTSRDAAPARVWVSATPHLLLTPLEPATPYVAVVRGTGCGDYYATVRFVTAPVVADAVVEHLRCALTVETVMLRGGGRQGRASPTCAGEGPSKHPALWTVLPASTVVQWVLAGHLTSATADGGGGGAAEGGQQQQQQRVEVVTHYTLCLVAANGELLRRWTSSPGTTTTVYHEWETRRDALWPHLEVMAAAEAVMDASSSSSDTSFVMPHPSQSGADCRTRLDLIGMAHLIDPTSTAETCAVRWDGTCREGYHVSWCTSTSLVDVHHATIPGSSATPPVFSLPLAALCDGPAFAVLCISEGSRQRYRQQTNGPTSSPVVCTDVSGVRDGGSNVLCVAWLLKPSGPPHGATQEAVVVHHTADLITLLLPPNQSLSAPTLPAVSDTAAASTCDPAGDVAPLLTRTWAVTDPTASTAAPQNLSLRQWTRDDCADRDVPNSGASLVDVCISSSRDALTGAVVELTCVDAVVAKQSPVWQRVVAHLLEKHQRSLRSSHSSSNDHARPATAVLPSLRWLRTVADARTVQHIGPVCTLRSLDLLAVEEDSVVRFPPLLGAAAADKRGSRRTKGDGRASPPLQRQAWLPLHSAAGSDPRRGREVSPQPEMLPCPLLLHVGEPDRGEEGLHDGTRSGSTAATRVQATMSELSALQAWTQRGHPTLRAHLTWVSEDDIFVLRVAGPYEAHRGGASQPRDEHSIDPVQQQRHRLRALLSPGVFPGLTEMPHQRTYTCLPTPDAAAAVGCGGHLALQLNGDVQHVPEAACHHDGEAEAANAVGRRFTVEVDGLVPESFYRLQVTGERSGDAVLRLQFVTPPSALSQVVTVSDAALDGETAERGTSTQRVRVHTRIYNPHAYSISMEGRAGTERRRSSVLAPEVCYASYTAVEVRSRDHATCLRDHHTYLSSNRTEEPGSECTGAAAAAAADVEGGVSPIMESSFTMAVEGAVEVYGMHHLHVTTTTATSLLSSGAESFLQPQHWGPLRMVTSRNWSAGPAMTARVEVPLCVVPQLPRVEKVSVLRRTPHSLRVGWRWRSGRRHHHDDDDGDNRCSGSQTRDPVGGVLSKLEAPPTLLCVRCVRVCPDANVQQQQQQHVDGCTVVVPVTASPAVTLAPLYPGTLYAVGIQEIPRGQAAGARAVVPSSLDALFSLAPLSTVSTHTAVREGDLYVVYPLPLAADVAAAVRALGRVSARPASLLLRPTRRTDRHDVPRGAVRCYVLTPPAAPPATSLSRRLRTECMRRRPRCVLLTLPHPYALPCIYRECVPASAGASEIRLLQYMAVVVVPENVVYVPPDAVAAMEAWWATTAEQHRHDSTSAGDMWAWWASRLRATFERRGLANRSERQMPTGRTVKSIGGVAVGTTSGAEHWTGELARRLMKGVRVEENREAAPARWPLTVRPLTAVRRGESSGSGSGGGGAAPTPAAWCFTVPVEEPPCSPSTDVGHAASTSSTKKKNWEQRSVYVLHCVEALSVGAAAATCDVMDGAQQLTVCHAPLAVKKLQLLRDLSVRTTASTDIEAPAELCVAWRWPHWAEAPSVSAAPTKPQRKNKKSVAALRDATVAAAAAKPQLRCRARFTCTPLSPPDGQAAAKEGGVTSAAVFVQHVEESQREVVIPGLAPATLYRLAFADVQHGTGSTAVRCADLAVTALTPPAAPAHDVLPQLHYTRLSREAHAARERETVTAEDAANGTSGLEVRFDLPPAHRTPQGLLLPLYALLVNLDAVDVAACRGAEDFLAAVQAEPAADDDPTAATAPVVYRNISLSQRLRTRITLHPPLHQPPHQQQQQQQQPHYALVFFHAVHVEESEGEAAKKGQRVEKIQERSTVHDGVERVVMAVVTSGPAKVLYSAPVVRPLLHHLIALTDAPTPPAAAAAAAHLFRSAHDAALARRRTLLLRCRPVHLLLQQRTPACLFLRWQLDLAGARLSDLERLQLLRRGVFLVRVAPDRAPDSVSPTASSGGSLVGQSRAGPHDDGEDGTLVLSAGVGVAVARRTVFYRANMSTPSSSEQASLTGVRLAESTAVSDVVVLRHPVCDYLASTAQTAATTPTDADAAAAAAVVGASSEPESGEVDAATSHSHACLTYQLTYPTPTYTAAHTGYTVSVALWPDGVDGEGGEGGSPSCSQHAHIVASAAPTPSAILAIPPVLLPLPVQRIVATDVTPSSCVLHWTVADGERPAAYAVHVTAHLVTAAGEAEEKSGVVWVHRRQQTSLALESLLPQTSYTMRVVPCNVYDEPCEEDNAVITVSTH